MGLTGNVLITGGAGFIGRWVVKAMLDDTSAHVFVLDDFSSGSRENLAEFAGSPRLMEVVKCGVQQRDKVDRLIGKIKPALVIHLAAQINVQNSIDDPCGTFDSDVAGTFRLLESCRVAGAGFIFMSTCMVYDLAAAGGSITELHPAVPRSPYAGAKLAAENMTISYFHAYGMPATVLRPFNTYGPYQKASGEGGVVSIFLARGLEGKDINIYGTGRQTRDLLYVEDCADFILRAASSRKSAGQILNAATGCDVSVNELAKMALSAVGKGASKIKHVKHIHPQSEIMKLCGNYDKAKRLLGWNPKVSLEEGLKRTAGWLEPLVQEGNKKWL